MKKVLCLFGCVIALMLAGWQLPPDPSVAGTVPVESDVEGMLPLRDTAEGSGYMVRWSENGSIALQKDDLEIQIKINDDTVRLNGEPISLSYTPVLVGGKTYLPVEFYNSIFTQKYVTRTGDNTYVLLDKTPVSADNMMDTVRELSQYPRSTGDATHRAAVEYVIDKLAAYGYQVEKQEFEYDIMDFDIGGRQTFQGTNLIAVKEADTDPTGDVLILGAHYDGAAGMPAANDNGSGLSVLLELARVLRYLPSDTEIRFVAFDAEEDGLYGSQTYVERLTDTQNIIGMLNFDMLGGAKAGYVSVHTADDRESYLMDILRLSYEFCGVERENQSYGTSDYRYFPARLIPALDFSHPVIRGEYHDENDLAEHISADMLEYAAKAGAAIATTIMSNITPSYLEQAKPKEPAEILEITPETYIPVSGSLERVERAFGIPLTQIESEIRILSGSLRYKIRVRLFDLEPTLDLVYSTTNPNVSNPYIDLTNSDLTCEEVKAMLDEKLGAGIPAEQITAASLSGVIQVGGGALINASGTSWVYNSLYGNSYQLSYRPGSDAELTVSIGTCQDNSAEAYQIGSGELVRLDSTDLTTVYEITRTKDGVSVMGTSPKPSSDLGVSERAKQCWDRMKSIMTEEELGEFSYFVLESDGFGHQTISAASTTGNGAFVTMIGNEDVEVPEEYQNLPENVQSFIRYMLARGNEGEKQTALEALSGKKLTVDYNDLLSEQGYAYTDTDFVKAFAVMKGTMLFDRQNQVDETQSYPENGTPFENITYSWNRDGEMYAFAEQFYQDIYSTERYYNYDLFSKYPDDFVSEDAAQSIESDMAYSFAAFVLQDKPNGDSAAKQKIRFFCNYPEIVAIRERLRQHM